MKVTAMWLVNSVAVFFKYQPINPILLIYCTESEGQNKGKFNVKSIITTGVE